MSDQNNILLVTDVSEEMQEDGKLSNDRKYKVITVVQDNSGGVIGTAREHRKVIWSHAPMSGPESDNPQPNHYYDKIEKGSRIAGTIEKVETKPYFIESENGQYSHPKTGKPANKVNQKTYVVFEDETAESLARADRNVELKEDEDEGQELQAAEEELVAEDLGEEAEEVAVS